MNAEARSRKKTKKEISKAMKELKKNRDTVTLKSIARITGRSAKTLSECYYDFISDQIEKLGIKRIAGSLSLEKSSIDQKNKLKEFMEMSDKSLGIGLKNYNR